ncbi:MAG: NAD(P)H-dependent oxidoreductase [Erythrobacter sp.]|uniref:flavodoxin family protein n=1 Tax=Erythrobacter sp. TaxID=1042 RepID=UPI0032EDF77F
MTLSEPLSAIALNCSLKPSSAEEPSSTDRMIALIADHLAREDVSLAETIRVADHDVKPGVLSDEGPGDAWPALREKVLTADILIFAGPIWLGQPSSIAKRVLERMDAFLGEADHEGRYPPYGKVAVVGVVGNEDGAHHVAAESFQALSDVGWTIPPMGSCYWVGEAMHPTDFKDLGEVPTPIATTARSLAANAAHVARLLKQESYPAPGDP